MWGGWLALVDHKLRGIWLALRQFVVGVTTHLGWLAGLGSRETLGVKTGDIAAPIRRHSRTAFGDIRSSQVVDRVSQAWSLQRTWLGSPWVRRGLDFAPGADAVNT